MAEVVLRNLPNTSPSTWANAVGAAASFTAVGLQLGGGLLADGLSLVGLIAVTTLLAIGLWNLYYVDRALREVSA